MQSHQIMTRLMQQNLLIVSDGGLSAVYLCTLATIYSKVSTSLEK